MGRKPKHTLEHFHTIGASATYNYARSESTFRNTGHLKGFLKPFGM